MVIQIIGYFQKLVNNISDFFRTYIEKGGVNLIYENICKLAKERGISINKLEEKANVSTGSICKWGNSVSPTVKNIKKVADILKCTVDELISATDETGSEEGRE